MIGKFAQSQVAIVCVCGGEFCEPTGFIDESTTHDKRVADVVVRTQTLWRIRRPPLVRGQSVGSLDVVAGVAVQYVDIG